MPPLKEDDVRYFGRPRVEQEMKDRLGTIDNLRDKAGGNLANLSGDDADVVRQLHADLNLLGERMDTIKEMDGVDSATKRIDTDLSMKRPGSPPVPGGNGHKAKVDWRNVGQVFTESNAYRSYRAEKTKNIESDIPIGSVLPEYRGLEMKGYRPSKLKAVLGTDTTAAGVASELPPESVRVGVVVEELFQVPNIADLMPQTTIDQNAVPFLREDVIAQGAAETEEAAAAPEANIAFTEDSAPVRKIAVTLPATEEILEDEQLTQGHINGRLPDFIRLREDTQLLNGDGVGQNLQGILTLSGIDATTSYSIGTPVLSAGQDKLEAVFSAGMRVMESFLMPDAVVTNLGVWEQIRLAKDANNNYLIAPSTDTAAPRLWGWRVVTNENMPAEAVGNTPILVGAFARASQIWRRRAISLAISDSHGTRFVEGILTVKATSRLAVTHYRPAGYAVITANS